MIRKYMKKISLLLCLIISLLTLSCGGDSNAEKTKDALEKGSLKEAETYLKKVSDNQTQRYYGGLLIDEYLAINQLDKAIYVFEKITGHCSMYDMKYESLHKSAYYTKEYSKKIYDALLSEGRYDEAWNYHSLSYDGEDYPGNAPDYFAYMSDCILQMCNSGQKAQVQKFIKQKSVWFLKNVDNHKWGKDYPNFRYDIMLNELYKVYNNAQ